MPLYTFYVYCGRHSAARAVHTVERDYWSDWTDLKQELQEAMVTAYLHYKVTSALVVVDKQKHKEKRMAYAGYAHKPQPYKREHQAYFQVEYNPASMRIKVKRAMLGGDFSGLIEEYYMLEKGIKYRAPPVIPKRMKALKQIMMMEGSVPTNSYIPVIKPQYAFTDDPKYWEKKNSYLIKPKRYYAIQ